MIREHAGLEKVVQKIGLEQPLLPDPDLGQDVAFLAFQIMALRNERDHYKAGLEALVSAWKGTLGITASEAVEIAKKALDTHP